MIYIVCCTSFTSFYITSLPCHFLEFIYKMLSGSLFRRDPKFCKPACALPQRSTQGNCKISKFCLNICFPLLSQSLALTFVFLLFLFCLCVDGHHILPGRIVPLTLAFHHPTLLEDTCHEVIPAVLLSTSCTALGHRPGVVLVGCSSSERYDPKHESVCV